MFFVPLAAAANSDRDTQTLTLLALVCALGAQALLWLWLSRRGLISPWRFGFAALFGAYSCFWWLQGKTASAVVTREDLTLRLLVIGAAYALGSWLYALALRTVFPRPARALAGLAIALVLLGLFPGPLMLFQDGTAALKIADVDLQLHAGFLYWTVGATLLVAPFLALTTLPGDWFERWWSELTARVMAVPSRVFIIVACAIALALTLFFTWYSFGARPTTADEIAQLWHARMLLAGRLAMPADPNPEFFAIDNIIDRPLWMSQFPIGGPAVLAIGVLLGVPWLLNPVLTALTALNVYTFARRAYGEALARAAVLVFALSPMVLIMGATYMNHTPTAWLVTLALAALPAWRGTDDPGKLRRAAALIGASAGAAVTLRPLDGVVVTAVIGLFALGVAVRDRPRARSLLIAIAAGAVPVALLLYANWRTTGNPLRFGYEVLWGANHSLGLHDDPTGNPHTAWRALLLGVKYAVQLNWIAMSWPVPILLIVGAGLLMSRRPNRWDVLLLAMFGAQLLVYAFYWHDGQFVGPRFLFAAVPALLILTARAAFIAGDRLRGAGRRVAMVLLPVCLGVSWLRTMPPFGVQALAVEFRESRTRLKVDPPREVMNGTVQNALIFVQEGTATRLLHRMWGIGVSRPNAARLLAMADGCSLLDAVRAEEQRAPADSAGRVDRILKSVRRFESGPASPRLPDPNFRVSDTSFVTPACANEIAHDLQVKNTIAYGPMLLLNRFEDSDRVGGSAVYVMDLGERNQVLRGRFSDRHWFRYELPRGRPDTLPVLVPYDAPR